MTHDTTAKPILFSGPLVRAILAGEKTQTRRLMHPRRAAYASRLADEGAHHALAASGAHPVNTRLWVRETWCCGPLRHGWGGVCHREVVFAADGHSALLQCPKRWRVPDSVQGGGNAPSIFMPRWASRITLRVTAARLERLQDITNDDIRAEGLVAAGMVGDGEPLREAWALGWDRINGKRHTPERPALWARNPWVIGYDFERVEVER